MKSILSLDDFLKQSEIKSITNEEDMDMNTDIPMKVSVDQETDAEGAEDMNDMNDTEGKIEVEIESDEKEEEKEDDNDNEDEKDANKKDEEEIEDAGEMAFGQLERCINYSKMLRERIQPGQEIEPWIAAKITKAMDYLQSVYNYLDGKDGEEEDVEEGED